MGIKRLGRILLYRVCYYGTRLETRIKESSVYAKVSNELKGKEIGYSLNPAVMFAKEYMH